MKLKQDDTYEGIKLIAPLASSTTSAAFIGIRGRKRYVIKHIDPHKRERLACVAERLQPRLVGGPVVWLRLVQTETRDAVSVTPYIQGNTFRELILKARKFTGRQLLRIVISAVRELRRLHQLGIYHGDIKPENLLLTRRGKVVVLDYDTAGVLDDSDSSDYSNGTRLRGTIPYIYPPTYIWRELTTLDLKRADYYSLALVICELATGICPIPYTGEDFLRLVDRLQPQPPLELNQYPELAQILRNLLNWRRDKAKSYRYDNSRLLLLDLKEIISRPLRRLVRTMSLVAVFIIAMLAIGLYGLSGFVSIEVKTNSTYKAAEAQTITIDTPWGSTLTLSSPVRNLRLPALMYQARAAPVNYYADNQAFTIRPWQTTDIQLAPLPMALWAHLPGTGLGYFGTPVVGNQSNQGNLTLYAGTCGLVGYSGFVGLKVFDPITGKNSSAEWDGYYPRTAPPHLAASPMGIKETSGLYVALPDEKGLKRNYICTGTSLGSLVLFDAENGTLIAEVTAEMRGPLLSSNVDAAPAAFDVDNDGVDELFAAFPEGTVAAYDWKLPSATPLQTIWQRSLPRMPTTPVLADVTGDGKCDLVTGCLDGLLYVLSATNGHTQATFDTGTSSYLYPAAVGDITGNGKPEIVVGSEQKLLFILRYDADKQRLNEQWRKQFSNAGGHTSLVDVTSDDVLDLIVTGNDGAVRCLTSANGTFEELWFYQTQGQIWGSPAVGYINVDNIPDIVAGSRDGNVYFINGKQGNLLYKYASSGEVWRSPVLHDFDRDGAQDAAFGSAEHGKATNRAGFYVVHGKPPAPLWEFQGPAEVFHLFQPLKIVPNGDPYLLVQFDVYDEGQKQAYKQYCLNPYQAATEDVVVWKGFTAAYPSIPNVYTDYDGDGINDYIQRTIGTPDLVIVSGKDGTSTFPAGSAGISASNTLLVPFSAVGPDSLPSLICINSHSTAAVYYSLARDQVIDELVFGDRVTAITTYISQSKAFLVGYELNNQKLFKIELVPEGFGEKQEIEITIPVVRTWHYIPDSTNPQSIALFSNTGYTQYDLSTMTAINKYPFNGKGILVLIKHADGSSDFFHLDTVNDRCELWSTAASPDDRVGYDLELAERTVSLRSVDRFINGLRDSRIDSVVLSDPERVRWFNLRTGEVLWQRRFESPILRAELVPPHEDIDQRYRLVVALQGGLLQCFELIPPLPANCNWDTYQGNNQRTGAFTGKRPARLTQ